MRILPLIFLLLAGISTIVVITSPYSTEYPILYVIPFIFIIGFAKTWG